MLAPLLAVSASGPNKEMTMTAAMMTIIPASWVMVTRSRNRAKEKPVTRTVYKVVMLGVIPKLMFAFCANERLLMYMYEPTNSLKAPTHSAKNCNLLKRYCTGTRCM